VYRSLTSARKIRSPRIWDRTLTRCLSGRSGAGRKSGPVPGDRRNPSILVRDHWLEGKKQVRAGVLTRDQFRKEVEQRIQKNVKPEEIRVESLTLQMFGFVPNRTTWCRTRWIC